MARVTIEDCLKKIDNAYDIVSLASQRAKDLLDGSEPKIDYPGKPSVVTLKEIAEYNSVKRDHRKCKKKFSLK